MALLLLALNARADVAFSPEGFLKIDGKPSLIIGMYELPEKDSDLQALADNGYNLVRGKEDKATLDRIQTHGMRAWIPINMALPDTTGEAAAKLGAIVDEFKSHPALLAWEAPDESLWNEWYSVNLWYANDQWKQLSDLIKQVAQAQPEKAAQLNQTFEQANDFAHRALYKESDAMYEKLWADLGAKNPHPELKMANCAANADELGRKLTTGWQFIGARDKEHVFWQNHAPRNAVVDLQKYNQAVHAAGCDIYPVPFNRGGGHSDLVDMNLTSVGAYTERMLAGAPGKACWMVLQGFGWQDLKEPGAPKEEGGRRPNFKETRFMAYNAIAHGAGAILYWGTYTIEKDSQLWKDLLRIGKELRALEPAIVASKPAHEPVAQAVLNASSFDGGQPRLILRKAGEDWVLFAINEARTGVEFTATGLPADLEGKKLYRLYTADEHTVKDGAFHDGIQALDVHVYATSRGFEAKASD
jgi:hypothetical protein